MVVERTVLQGLLYMGLRKRVDIGGILPQLPVLLLVNTTPLELLEGHESRASSSLLTCCTEIIFKLGEEGSWTFDLCLLPFSTQDEHPAVTNSGNRQLIGKGGLIWQVKRWRVMRKIWKSSFSLRQILPYVTWCPPTLWGLYSVMPAAAESLCLAWYIHKGLPHLTPRWDWQVLERGGVWATRMDICGRTM